MRDTLESRGPDGTGLWLHENLALAQRRLAVLDPSQAGEQPMATPDGRYHLLYNGELYNDAELREDLLALEAVPGGFRSECDTETVLWAFAAWGPAAFERMRGMFALAIYDSREHVLHLARDPLGVKPLYFVQRDRELCVASEPKTLLAHPGIEALPNLPMASAYLSTLRSTLGRHTLFHGVSALQPGEHARFDARTGELHLRTYYRPRPVRSEPIDVEQAAGLVRRSLEDSVGRHLRADVPVAALLSGGLDSSVVCWSARERLSELHTWCAAGRGHAEGDQDLEFARLASAELGSEHTEVLLDQGRFLRDWQQMIERNGLPLSTPNEVAIHAIARDMRRAGFVVALSGEGADELFGGYGHALRAAATYCQSKLDRRSGGRFQLESSAWVPTTAKPHLLSADAWHGVGADELLLGQYDAFFHECEREVGDAGGPLDAHLRFLRRINLTGLLQRLDSSTMLASIEGRTPFADSRVAALADSLPMSVKWGESTKACLREAWRDEIPADIVNRQKQSFPLPFQDWIAKLAWRLDTSPFAKVFFADRPRREVSAQPLQNWQLAWPMLNLSLWADSWWS